MRKYSKRIPGLTAQFLAFPRAYQVRLVHHEWSRQSRLPSFGVRRLAAAFPQASLLAGLSAPTSASKLAETKRQAAALQSCAGSFA